MKMSGFRPTDYPGPQPPARAAPSPSHESIDDLAGFGLTPPARQVGLQDGFGPAIACRDAGDAAPELFMRIALYQPDIPQNTGTILRLCACLDVEAHIIEPAGFPISDRHFRRSGMDYLDQVSVVRHDSWGHFAQWRTEQKLRLVLFTTKGATPYLEHRYAANDILLFGRESAGVPDEVAAAADTRVVIPIRPDLRSLNLAMATAMALGEALRQTRG